MNDRDIEDEITAFFRRTATPEPSMRLRDGVVHSRTRARIPPQRLGRRRAALSAIGVAATVVIAVGVLFVALRNDQGSGNTGPATGLRWQTGQLSPNTRLAFEQFVSIGNRLYLITSNNGAGDPTGNGSEGIWASNDGLAWAKQSDISVFTGGGSDRPVLVAAAPNGTGGAVVVGSSTRPDGSEQPAAWWTTDGERWQRATVGGPAGRMLSVAGRQDGLTAVGVNSSGGAAAWHSADGGSSWTSVSLPGAGRDAVDVIVWGSRFIAIGRSTDGKGVLLWASADGAAWTVVTSPSDPSFSPHRLLAFGSVLAVVGRGLPAHAILACGEDLRCAPAAVPSPLGASFTEIRAGANVSGTIVVSTLSASAGTALSPSSSAATAIVEFWTSIDGRSWTSLSSDPSAIFVTSNIGVLRGRLVVVAIMGSDLTAPSGQILVGDLR